MALAAGVEDTKFSVDRGYYPGPVEVVISSATPGAMISFTTDGSTPEPVGGTSSPVTVSVDRSLVLRAVAYVGDGSLEPTGVDTHTYVITSAPLRWSGTSLGPSAAYPADVVASLESLPALFVAIHPGDFATVRDSGTGSIGSSGGNEAYERPCSAELWYPAHPRFEGFEGFQVDAGLRPHSWVTTKRSFRLYFKRGYGAGKLRYPLFESAPWAGESAVEVFDKVVLRNHSNDGWEGRWGGAPEALYLRDQFARASQIDMTGIGSRSMWVHLFINGGYYGIYNPSERPDDDFLASYLGGSDDDYLGFNHGGVINEGADETAYDAHRNPGDLSGDAAYEAFQEVLDPEQFSDYLIGSWFNMTHDHDWPVNGSRPQNFYGGNRTNPPGPTMHFTWDFEASLVWDSEVHPKFRRGSSDADLVFIETWFALVENDSFLRGFADRAFRHLFNGGALSPGPSADRLAAMANHVRPALDAERWQWGDPFGQWDSRLASAESKLTTNPANLVASLRSQDYYPDVDPPVLRSAGEPIVVQRLRVPAGFQVEIAAPPGGGTVYYTTDGATDPADPGATAGGSSASVTAAGTTVLRARTLDGGGWSALRELVLLVDRDFWPLRIGEVMYHPSPEPAVNGMAVVAITGDSGFGRARVQLAGPPPVAFTGGDHVRLSASAVPGNNGQWSIHEVDGDVLVLDDALVDEAGSPALADLLYDGDRYEFIEVANAGGGALDLTGVTFSKGVGYTFPDGFVLGAGASVVVAAQPWDFAARYPGVPLAPGRYLRGLDNGGEVFELSSTDGVYRRASALSADEAGGIIELESPVPAGIGAGDRVRVTGCELVTNNGSYRIDSVAGSTVRVGREFVDAPDGARVEFFELIDRVDYDDGGAWPIAADGYGFSLVPDGTAPTGWRASAMPGGSPGAFDPVPSPLPVVLVNEALTHTDLPQVDLVELHNPGGTPADIGGWWLTDDRGDPTKFRVPDGTTIAPGGFRVFDEADFGGEFLLSSTGEEVYVFSPDLRSSHGFEFGAAENGVSFGRHGTSDGREVFVRQSAVTAGSANSGPRTGPVVISEFHYHPPDGSFEFLELVNASASPVDLSGWTVGGIGFTFPPGVVLQPAEVVLLVQDPAAAASAPAGVAHFVYPSRLSNGGERVRLVMPDGEGGSVVIDEVDYDDSAPWPVAADGGGPSLERVWPPAFGDDPLSWRASLGDGGTPGVNIPPTTPLVAVSPPSVAVSAIEGFNPDPVVVEVWNAGIGTLGYSVGDSAPWLSVAPASGSSTGAGDRTGHALEFAAATLAPGRYEAAITVTSGGAANAPVVVAVTLDVVARDRTPPGIESVEVANAGSIVLVFDEPVQPGNGPGGAESATRYSVEPGGSVLGAVLAADGRTVALSTGALVPGTLYTVQVDGVADRAEPLPNPVAPGTSAVVFYEASVLPDGLVAHWSFDEGSGATADDTAGGNTLALHQSPLWAPGHDGTGSALRLNGSDEFGSRSDGALSGQFPCRSSGAAESFTIAARIKLARLGHRHAIFTKQGNGTRGFLFSVEESNRLNLELFRDQSVDTDTQSGTTLQANRWYHVAVTYGFAGDGSSRVRLYIDGAQEGGNDSAVGPPAANGLDLELGRYWWSGSYNRFFDGWIDDVMFFDRDLDADEVAQVYTGAPPVLADPVVSPPGGEFEGAVEVTLSHPVPEAALHFTVDGSDPTPASPLYEEPFTLAAAATVKARAFAPGRNPSETTEASFSRIVSSGEWWNTALPFRVPVTVDPGAWPRADQHCAVVPVDFTSALLALGESGALVPDSVRVVEVDAGGAVIDSSVPFQFDPGDGFDAATDASGEVVVALEGNTPASAVRRYHVYFATSGTHAPPAVAPLLTTTPNTSDGGFASVAVETPIGTWQYHYTGAGFSSLDDTDGNDWIGWSTSSGANGAYRGIPNLAYHSGYFHPGGEGNPSTTTVDRAGPVRTTLTSVSEDDEWELRWDIFPAYARLTVVRRDPSESYWFLYEGTPGGGLDLASDYSVRPDGTRLPLGTSWTGDLPGQEWAYFEDTGLDRALYAVQHEPDGNTDSYWQLSNAMTVFGFGRLNLNTYLETAPNVFTVGLADGASSFAHMAEVIDSAYRPMAVNTGIAQRIAGATGYDAWAAGHFPPEVVGDPALSDTVWGPLANADGDPLNNVLEWATGRDPLAADTEPALELGSDGSLRFQTTSDLAGLEVTVETTPDFASWSAVPASVVEVSPDGSTWTWEATLPGDAPRRFVRLMARLLE